MRRWGEDPPWVSDERLDVQFGERRWHVVGIAVVLAVYVSRHGDL